MKKITSMVMATLMILVFHSVSLAATRELSSRPPTGAVVSDVLVLRSLGFAGTVLGSAAFAVSLPVTLASHQVDRSEKLLVQEPYDYTFERPLGQMQSGERGCDEVAAAPGREFFSTFSV